MSRADLNQSLNLRRRAWQHDSSRDRSQRRKAITLIGLKLITFHDYAIRSNCGFEFSDNGG
jgi:hypothetical protein